MILCSTTFSKDQSEWINRQYENSKSKLLNNISPKNSISGTIVASPSRNNPDYYYHWIRDASLVMKTVFEIMSNDPTFVDQGTKLFSDFIKITRIHQQNPSPAGLGEVKFLTNGSPYLGPWGRPQNDGPSLRAITLIKYANYLLNKGQFEFVRKFLYDSKIPTSSVIKRDLEYISHIWKDSDYDLWEEVKATHFFTRVVQWRALVDGAQLAIRLNDRGAAEWYRKQAHELLSQMGFLFWKDHLSAFVAHANRVGGIEYKSGIDSSIFIAANLLNESSDFSITDDRFLLTLNTVESLFSHLYATNVNNPHMAPAIGRYPEDLYDGTGVSHGNPWFLTTLSVATYYYQLALKLNHTHYVLISKRNLPFWAQFIDRKIQQIIKEDSYLKVTGREKQLLIQALIQKGDRYLERVRFHLPLDGSMSEQINRDIGYMQGAHDLTWSYAYFIDAIQSRRKVVSP